MRPVLDSSSFAPVLRLPRRTCLHSASSILTVRISCHVISVCVQKALIYQLNFTIFMFVTRISHYIQRSVLSMVSHNRSRSWNVVPTDTGTHLYTHWFLRTSTQFFIFCFCCGISQNWINTDSTIYSSLSCMRPAFHALIHPSCWNI
jgi:hypothetical protein